MAAISWTMPPWFNTGLQTLPMTSPFQLLVINLLMCCPAPGERGHAADPHLISLDRIVPSGCRLYAKRQWQEHPARGKRVESVRKREQVGCGLMILVARTGSLCFMSVSFHTQDSVPHIGWLRNKQWLVGASHDLGQRQKEKAGRIKINWASLLGLLQALRPSSLVCPGKWE